MAKKSTAAKPRREAKYFSLKGEAGAWRVYKKKKGFYLWASEGGEIGGPCYTISEALDLYSGKYRSLSAEIDTNIQLEELFYIIGMPNLETFLYDLSTLKLNGVDIDAKSFRNVVFWYADYRRACEYSRKERHLLACFDEGGDGEFGIGVTDGALIDATEIPQVLERAQLAWVQSVRATGRPKAPPWIMKEPGLRRYFDALGGIDLNKYDSDEDAASDLAACTDNEPEHAREDFLWDALRSCGWGGGTSREEDVRYGGVPAATNYQYWWAPNPREIVEKFRTKLQNMMLQADRAQ